MWILFKSVELDLLNLDNIKSFWLDSTDMCGKVYYYIKHPQNTITFGEDKALRDQEYARLCKMLINDYQGVNNGSSV